MLLVAVVVLMVLQVNLEGGLNLLLSKVFASSNSK